MSADLRGVRVGLIERRHPTGSRGSLVETLAPKLAEHGAEVDLVHAESGGHRLDAAPPWDVAILKSGSAAALHLAAAAEAWAVPCLNGSAATRLTQDKLASSAILQRAGLPIAPSRLVWIDGDVAADPAWKAQLGALGDRRQMVKAARGSRGVGFWTAEPGALTALATTLPAGPYLVMEWIPHDGDDLKVFVAGEWMAAVERPFPAATPEAKLGRPAGIPDTVAEATRQVGAVLGLSCYGCDFVAGSGGWTLVDVNAFPGYKGAPDAAAAIVREAARVVGRRAS